jgi:hypothetical protein
MRRAGTSGAIQPPLIKKHTAKETIQILTGAAVGSSEASFATT